MEWLKEAACRDHDPELWFDGRSDKASRICDRCPVQLDCLMYGVETESVGIFGGLRLGGDETPRRHQDSDRRRNLAVLMLRRGASNLKVAAALSLEPAQVRALKVSLQVWPHGVPCVVCHRMFHPWFAKRGPKQACSIACGNKKRKLKEKT